MSLQDLMASTTPGPWEHRVWGHEDDGWPENRVSVGTTRGRGEAVCLNPRYGDREQDLANAALIALAPDAVALLIDSMPYLRHGHGCGVLTPSGCDCGLEEIVTRFAALNEKAGT